MSRHIAVQMDHISAINREADSTFALLLEAKKRGFHLYHYTPDDLSYFQGKIVCSLSRLDVWDTSETYFTLEPPQRRDLREMDVILMRQDPPFDLSYITATHFLEKLHPKPFVVNHPASVRNMPEKLFVTEFSDLTPPTVISRNRAEIDRFRREQGAVVMKPLFGHGGAGVFLISENDPNFNALFDLFSTLFREPWVTQKFLPAVAEGDKRILLIDGAPVGAVNRLPQKGEIRSNLACGGSGFATTLTSREEDICARLGPALKESGITLAGIDIIGGWLTEINVTSPTGIRSIVQLGGVDAAALFWDAVLERMN